MRRENNHTYAPAAWRSTPNITGDYDFDAAIAHCKNKSVPLKLDSHLTGPYTPQTAYNAYSGYSTVD